MESPPTPVNTGHLRPALPNAQGDVRRRRSSRVTSLRNISPGNDDNDSVAWAAAKVSVLLSPGPSIDGEVGGGPRGVGADQAREGGMLMAGNLRPSLSVSAACATHTLPHPERRRRDGAAPGVD